MHYKLIIIDRNYWMYIDIAIQIKTMLIKNGDIADIIDYEYGDNNYMNRYIFLGTLHKNNVKIPPNSIITNFDNHKLLFDIITDEYINNCEIWDYCEYNIKLIYKKNPNARCFHIQMGYSPLIDYNCLYIENNKDIDILFLGNVSERRNFILNKLRSNGYNICVVYHKTSKDMSEFIKRSKICISIYSSEDKYTISSIRFSPILCNNGFIISEISTCQKQNEYWSDYIIAKEYNELCDTVEYYINKPEERKKIADECYEKFKQTTCHLNTISDLN